MRADLRAAAEKAAAESYGRDHRFFYVYGHRFVVPGLAVGAVVVGYLFVQTVGWGTALGYLAVSALVVAAVVAVVGYLASHVGRGPRLTGGFRPPKLPPGV